jgi:hypothetical protein
MIARKSVGDNLGRSFIIWNIHPSGIHIALPSGKK